MNFIKDILINNKIKRYEIKNNEIVCINSTSFTGKEIVSFHDEYVYTMLDTNEKIIFQIYQYYIPFKRYNVSKQDFQHKPKFLKLLEHDSLYFVTDTVIGIIKPHTKDLLRFLYCEIKGYKFSNVYFLHNMTLFSSDKQYLSITTATIEKNGDESIQNLNLKYTTIHFSDVILNVVKKTEEVIFVVLNSKIVVYDIKKYKALDKIKTYDPWIHMFENNNEICNMNLNNKKIEKIQLVTKISNQNFTDVLIFC